MTVRTLHLKVRAAFWFDRQHPGKMLNIGGIHHEQAVLPLSGNHAELIIHADSMTYHFYAHDGDTEIYLGTAQSKFLINEVFTGFIGTVQGLFVQNEGESRFDALKIVYPCPAA